MRIITGTQRGKKLIALEGEQVRPTTDRVKEALFDILQFRLEGRAFLDLFAGSGQIGLEALSRGAARACFVDSLRDSMRVVKKNIASTGLALQASVFFGDFQAFFSQSQELFDIAFLDPPYRTGLLEKALRLVPAHMNPGGIIVCEHPLDEALPQMAEKFEKQKSYRYGKILLTTYSRPLAEEEEK